MEVSEVKKGMHVIIDGDLYRVVDFLHVKPGKGSAFMQTKLKNIKTGATIERNFNTNYKIELAQITRLNMQYLYNDGSTYYFMDNNTYEQMELSSDLIGDNKDYLIENNNVDVQMFNGELLGIILPEKLEMTVVSLDSASSSKVKYATTETGLVVEVPLFINEGEKIIVSTSTGEYVSRG